LQEKYGQIRCNCESQVETSAKVAILLSSNCRNHTIDVVEETIGSLIVDYKEIL